MNTITHYVPVFAKRSGRREASVCGVYCDRVIAPQIHSIDPSCPDCRRLLKADDEAAARLSAKWEAEELDRRQKEDI